MTCVAECVYAAFAVGLTVVIFILWPLLALPARVFSQGYFTMWIVIALIWGSIAGATVCQQDEAPRKSTLQNQ